MDQARDLGFVFSLDGDAVPVSAHGDDAVLQIGGIGGIDHFCQLLVHLVAGLLHLAPDLAQGGRSVIRDLFL